jgi:KTSC domain
MPSSVIRAFSYDAYRRELLIVFQSGRRYIYQGVPEETFRAMKAAFAKGRFFNTEIRERFGFIRIDVQDGKKNAG